MKRSRVHKGEPKEPWEIRAFPYVLLGWFTLMCVLLVVVVATAIAGVID